MPPQDRKTAIASAFTLAELLVAMAVLSVILVLVAQMVGGASSATTFSQKRIDADTQARLIFDKLNMDLARMVNRPDVDFFSKGLYVDDDPAKGADPQRVMRGNDEILFYSSVPGYFSGGSAPASNNINPVSLVGYAMGNDASGRPVLFRLAKGLGLEPGTAWKSFSFLPVQIRDLWPDILDRATGPAGGMEDPDYQVIGDSVVRFEYSYILKPDAIVPNPSTGARPPSISIVPYGEDHLPKHTSRDFHRDVGALAVSLALVDPLSRVIINDYSDLTSDTLFPDAVAGELPDIAWTDKINSSTFAADAGLPAGAASSVRVYRRVLNLGIGQ